MKLLVVSHTPHYLDSTGRPVGWGATVRELDRLSLLFDRLIHLAPVYDEAPPPSSLPYVSDRIELRALPRVGGDGPRAKLGILAHAPGFYRRLYGALGEVDAVHVRAPANVALLAMAAFSVRPPRRPCWIKYAGNWRPDEDREPDSYRRQRRWLLRPRPDLAVTVNGRRAEDGDHVFTFMNPCLTRGELAAARRSAEEKSVDGPLELLFVGRLDGHKGALRALRVLGRLAEDDVDARLTLAGDGPLRGEAERTAMELGVADRALFTGWLSRAELDDRYARAHALLLPSDSEGWPKVLSEAMAHGALALTSRVSSVAETLERLGGEETVGWTFAPGDVEGYAAVAASLLASPDRFRTRSRRAAEAAEAFTYARYLERVRELFRESFGIALPPPDGPLAV